MKIERTITATLKLDTAAHIGTGKEGNITDSPLRRTGDGVLFLPGRAIGGSLRTLATRLAPRLGLRACTSLAAPAERTIESPCLCPVCQLFGDLYPNEHDFEETGGAASRVWIYDAFLQAEEQSTHIRDGVGIDRETGTAARQIKFDYEVIPRQAHFGFRLRLVDDDSEEALTRAQVLVGALAEWQQGRGTIGGNIARGLGRFHLEEDLSCARTMLQTADDLMAYLAPNSQRQFTVTDDTWWQTQLLAARSALEASPPTLQGTRGFVSIAFKIRATDFFLINDPLVALLSGFDHGPMVEVAVDASRRAGTPILPGSSLRGAIRSRAEKIVRTLAMLHWRNRETFLHNCPACNPLAREERAPLQACNTRLDASDAKEVLESDLCLACRLFGSPRRGSRLWVADAHWQNAALQPQTSKAQDFLAIDRFTGGGQTGAKFDAAPLAGASFCTSIVLHAPQAWELGWLLLVLRDIADGELTLGFGSAKGYGRAKATDFRWEIGYLTPDDFLGASELLHDAKLNGLHHVVEATCSDGEWLPSGWRAQADTWLAAFHEQIENFTRSEGWQPFAGDTFLTADGQIEALYGLPHTEGGASD